MINDADAIDLVASAYFDASFKWDHWFDGPHTDDVKAGIKVYDDCVAVVYPGTENVIPDGLRDFDAAVPVEDPILGQVPRGFNLGMQKSVNAIIPLLQNKPIVIVGHSLGAARTQQAAGYMIKEGLPVVSIVTAGSPLPGTQQLKDILAPFRQASYKNRFDPITLVPAPYIGYNVMHMSPFVMINEKPAFFDPWGIFADHHIELYQKGIRAMVAP